VKNDGKGFNYTPEKSGFGILGMQKRARDVEGIFCISSARVDCPIFCASEELV
jgi:signal transduction histidine kinase